MTDYIAPKLVNRVIPVTKGTDRIFSIRRFNNQNLSQAWNCDVFIDIDIDKTAPTRIPATIDFDTATIRIESSVADLCKNTTTWRAVMSQGGSPTLETAILVGTFERNDGK